MGWIGYKTALDQTKDVSEKKHELPRYYQPIHVMHVLHMYMYVIYCTLKLNVSCHKKPIFSERKERNLRVTSPDAETTTAFWLTWPGHHLQ